MFWLAWNLTWFRGPLGKREQRARWYTGHGGGLRGRRLAV